MYESFSIGGGVGTTLDCIIWSLVDTHKSVTFGLGLNHIRLQHFYMIQHVQCCCLMWFNPRPNDALLCVSTKDQMI